MPKHALLFPVFLACLWTAQLHAQGPVPLPVKKVELYKNGMGYFEHLGTVKGEQGVEIVLPSSQLNDVLKSLTILDLGRGQIGAVKYDSAAPLERRLAEVPIDLPPDAGLVEFLNRIRGADIEVGAPAGIVKGKLLGAELRSRSTGPGAASQVVQVSAFTSAGEIRLVELESAGALKLIEPALAADLGRYLDLLKTTRQRDVRRLRIETPGTAEREIFISYTSESPIWKTTYRIILDPKQKPLLQGWAIVDNTTPMDWLNVSLSLVSGAPISFIQDLSQPIYAQRPVVPLPRGIQVTPQVYEGTIETEAEDESKAAPLRARPEAGAAMDGRLAGRALMEAAPAPPRPPSPVLADAFRQQAFETAQAQAAAEQFEYRIRQPVTIRRNESALLPIIQSDLEGEKVSVYKSTSGERNPRLAFWLGNASGLTLDAGPVTVIDTNTFAGEGLIESVQPGERRLLSYAVDLGTEVSNVGGSERQRVERVVIHNGMMRMFARMIEKKTYKIRNNNPAPRTVVIEHPVRSNWKLVGMTPAESSASFYRFRIQATPKSTTEYIVQEESPLESQFAVSSVTPEQIVLWVRERSIDPETEKALRAIADEKNEINDLNQKFASLDKEQNEIFRDQERIRGNLQRLSQTPEEAALRQRYIRQLEAQESRLSAMREERDKLEPQRSAAQEQLDEMIQKLSVDRKV